MTLTLPIGRLAFSVELRVRRNARRVARSGVKSHGDGKLTAHPLARTGRRPMDSAAERLRAEAFVQLVNRRLV